MELGEGIRKFFLLGIGATATTIEKSTEIIDDLVKKGEITVEQGKVFNQELKRTMKENVEAAAAAGANAKAAETEAACEEPDEDPKDFSSYVAGLSAEELEALKEEIEKAQV